MPIRGRVRWFNNEKGYGFIEQDNGADVFAHYRSMENTSSLKKKDVVEFEIEESEKGPKAIKIQRIN